MARDAAAPSQHPTARRIQHLLRCAADNRPPALSQPSALLPTAAAPAEAAAAAAASAAEAELHWLSIAEAGAAFSTGKLSPVELLDAVLARLDATEDTLCSFVNDMRSSARAQAEASAARWERGAALGPMDGIPICFKDLYDCKGSVTAAGSFSLRDRVPAEDAHTVNLLREAGAVFVGKTFTSEFASNGMYNPQYRSEVCKNPFNIAHQPGISSAGTASAVAGGQALGGTGSCTGGSLRGPSSYCNLTGLKPTYGLCSKRGMVALSKTLDHAGPMCRSALDCAIFLDAMKGYDPQDPCSSLSPVADSSIAADLDGTIPAGATLIVIPSMLRECQPDILATFERSVAQLEEMGCEVCEAEPLAGFDPERVALAKRIVPIEKNFEIGDILRNRPTEVSLMCQDSCLNEEGEVIEYPASVYIGALEARHDVEQRFEATLAEHAAGGKRSFYVLPTMKDTAPLLSTDLEAQAAARPKEVTAYNTPLFNMSRQPAVSVPNGVSDVTGLPTGLQLVGRQWDDAGVLQLGHAYQSTTDFHLARPTL